MTTRQPHAKKVGHLRSALIDAVSPEDIAAIVGKLVEQAKAGDVWAILEVLDRTLGKPVEAHLIERLEQLEAVAIEMEVVPRRSGTNRIHRWVTPPQLMRFRVSPARRTSVLWVGLMPLPRLT